VPADIGVAIAIEIEIGAEFDIDPFFDPDPDFDLGQAGSCCTARI
jgi:hypothetical protein